MPKTVVTNNKEALVMGQMPHLGKDSAGVPQVGEIIKLLPGANLVDSDKLKTLRKNSAFDGLFKSVIESSPAPEQNPEKVGKPILVQGEELPDTSPLAKLKPKAKEALIADTFQVDLLQGWLAEEGENGTRAIIQNQIDRLRSGTAGGGPAAAARA